MGLSPRPSTGAGSSRVKGLDVNRLNARKAVVTPQADTEDLEDLSEGLGTSSVDEELSNLASAATSSTTVDEEEDDALSYFQKLAEE